MSTEYFSLSKIKFDPNAPADALCFKHYDADRVVMGKTMKEHLRFAVCYWHTFRGVGADPFGPATIKRSWDDGSNSLENAERRMRVAFEFFSKLGNPYWTFHDRDIAPEGKDLAETNANLDHIVKVAKELQAQTGIKLLWGTSNLFSNPRYMHGGASNPDVHVFAYAGAQVKKMLEVTKDLGGENFVFWGGREGYANLLSLMLTQELDQLANFFRMAASYADEIGFTGQLLIEPKPKEPSSHQYDYDAQTVIGFLKTYGLDKRFKLNIEPNHSQLAGHQWVHCVYVASKLGMLGSIDANTGTEGLGWDTDQFPMDLKNNTLLMLAVLKQNGIAPGGLNFDCKVRRESSDVEDMFWGHVGAMDSLAQGLLAAAKILEEGKIDKMIEQRYSSWTTPFGQSIMSGSASLKDCEAFILKNGEPVQISGKQEKYETMLNRYIN